jgi:hypothetical protein
MSKYKTVKYGQAKYGGEKRPFNIRVILRDKNNSSTILVDPKAVFHELADPYKYKQRKYGQATYSGKNRQPVLLDVSWEYNRIGGCGSASMSLALPYQSVDVIEEGTEIQIDVIRNSGELYETWYRGEVANRSQKLGLASTVSLQVQGFVMQLERVRLDNITFTDSNTDSIVAFIIDNYVAPDTQIKRTPSKGLVRAEGFVVDSITFNGSAMSAIRSLSEISGNAEWGVNNEKEIFFVVRSNDVKNAFVADELHALNEVSDFSGIINEYKLFGAGSYVRTKTDLASQDSFGKRNAILQQSAISTDDTADQYIDGYLTDSKEPLTTVNAIISNVRKQVETLPPQGAILFALLGSSPFVTSKYQMERINYALSNGDGLTVNIVGGKIREDISETIGYLNNRLNQIVDT